MNAHRLNGVSQSVAQASAQLAPQRPSKGPNSVHLRASCRAQRHCFGQVASELLVKIRKQRFREHSLVGRQTIRRHSKSVRRDPKLN